MEVYLDPSSWRCSMIWSAYMGLPHSLEGVGTVLALGEQKLKEGKDLIKYFCLPCKPTKVNGGRTRNLPAQDREKWTLFKQYNVRDIEVEQAVILRKKGKIAELALGYGGSVGALKAMGALEMGLTEDELQPLVDSWRASNPRITKLWWDIDRNVKEAVRLRTHTQTHGLNFYYQKGMLFIELPSGRRLSYVKPKIEQNQFGGESVTYEGTGNTKKWERIESYGPKFTENVVQAISRDILAYAMRTLRHCFICGHVHDELIIECSMDASLEAVCEQMGRTPPWMKGLELRADGYVTMFYRKD